MELIAHRGMPRKLRENTLGGFRMAQAAGVDGIELDVHATADGVVVVHHDPHLPARGPTPARPDHSSPSAGAAASAAATGALIARHSLAELRRVAPYALDTLQEVLAAIATTITLYVEVKAPGIEPLVAELLPGHEARCAIHAFDHRIPRRIAAMVPRVPCGILSSSYLLHPGRALREAEARDYWQRWELIDEALVREVHDVGGRVVAWTVNDAEAVQRLAAIGVDAICTDVPDEMGHVARASARG